MLFYNSMLNIIQKLNKATEDYELGIPSMSDKEWDDLYFDLVKLEKDAGYILEGSPTNNITNPVVSSLEKVEHNHKMLSLEKTKEIEEVFNFLNNKETIAMCKMDGLTCSLKYSNGKLISAETRGNGVVGENILHNAQVVKSIPTYIDYKKDLVIDGEIICTYQNFESFNEEYKNPRNFASGSIRLLNGKECEKRNLTFVAWEIIQGLDNHISHFNEEKEYWDVNRVFETKEENKFLSDKLHDLHKLGFTTVPHFIINKQDNIEKIETVIEDLKEVAQQHSYPIDGIVFKFNDIQYGLSLGETTHHFKNALAFKFYDETYETKLFGIDYDVSRNGILTPVAIFEPIDIEGSEVCRANLHNLSVMKSLLGETPFIGQQLSIYRANMIIPQVYSSVKLDDTIEPVSIQSLILLPKNCPVCGEPLKIQKSDTGIETLVCVNPTCGGTLLNKLDYFCGKKGLDIKGLSVATIGKLIDWGWVNTFEDIFNLKQYEQEWQQKEGFGEKSVSNILNSIEKAKNCHLSSFLAAIGIPFIGHNVAKDLAANVIDYVDFRERVYDGWNFASIPNFGQAKMDAILNFNYEEADKIYKLLNITNEKQQTTNSLQSLVFVVTGKLNSFKNRNLLKEEIEKRGGKVTDAVTTKTNYLINNDNKSKSAKNLKAQQLGVQIITEEEFLNLIQ